MAYKIMSRTSKTYPYVITIYMSASEKEKLDQLRFPSLNSRGQIIRHWIDICPEEMLPDLPKRSGEKMVYTGVEIDDLESDKLNRMVDSGLALSASHIVRYMLQECLDSNDEAIQNNSGDPIVDYYRENKVSKHNIKISLMLDTYYMYLIRDLLDSKVWAYSYGSAVENLFLNLDLDHLKEGPRLSEGDSRYEATIYITPDTYSKMKQAVADGKAKRIPDLMRKLIYTYFDQNQVMA